ncbi:putative peroxygenase 3 [Golovinomyces cichoracearum]|uniref:Putative peroxygenase 3 n=1 Tax=Golovinomyces cichoracearum TaxID=62708 RepID=A0A420JB90_9PEZI|nr:putative peroxygenase 3 [Golovinomyces cichoracearum]
MDTEASKEQGFDIAIPQVAVTEQRIPFIQDRGNVKLKQAGTARANEAASFEAPYGTKKGDYAFNNRDKTVLQQHISFFDPDNDGTIWPLDTFHGFRLLGFNLFLSILSTVIIHGGFSYPTGRSIIPDPFFRIFIARIHKDKHGSDSGSYDPEGRFEPQKFEDIFAKYASGDKKGITLVEIFRYMKGQRVVLDPFGWFAALFEWIATYILLWPADGRMMKEDIRRIFDGSLFYEISARRMKAK